MRPVFKRPLIVLGLKIIKYGHSFHATLDLKVLGEYDILSCDYVDFHGPCEYELFMLHASMVIDHASMIYMFYASLLLYAHASMLLLCLCEYDYSF